MLHPAVTVTKAPDGSLRQAPGAHAWWMSTAADEIRLGLIDTIDAKGRARHACALSSSDETRQELRAAEVALHEAHRHLERARAKAIQ
jgi:hypothetical protein